MNNTKHQPTTYELRRPDGSVDSVHLSRDSAIATKYKRLYHRSYYIVEVKP